MKEINFRTEWRAWLLIISSFVLSFWAYPQLPATVASHWNFQGQVDGWTGKNFHCLFFPSLLIIIYAFMLIAPYLDPRKERYQEFAKVYRLMRDAIIAVLAGVFAVATFYNLSYHINVGVIVSLLIGSLIIMLGNYFGKLKRNWFIGIRTPWTMSSENVWNRSHRLSGRLFMVWGLGIIIAPWINFSAAMIILFGGLLLIIGVSTIYSYALYKQEKNNK